MNMRARLVSVLLLQAIVVATGAAATASAASNHTLHLKLTGPSVVHSGDPNGVADAALMLDVRKQQLCWAFSHLAGIAPPKVGRISRGSKGKTGASVLALGRSYKSKGCVKARASLLRALLSRPADYYLTLWAGQRYPDGVVRGQL